MAILQNTETIIKIEQLQPGVFIRLDESWFNHPFLFKKFKIKNTAQIDTLRSLGITEVVYIPEKSDCLPLPLDGFEKKPPPQQAHPSLPQEDPMLQLLWQIKKERIEKLKEKREALRQCTENYNSTVKDMPSLMNSIISGSKEAVINADTMVSGIVKKFLGDTDAVMHLMNTKETEESIYYHSLNVSVLALMLGSKAQLTPAEMQNLGMGALFHDIGKNRIDKKVLNKNTPLTKAELSLIQLHPRYGIDIVSKCNVFPNDAAIVIWQHHELCNGNGYPQSLKQEKISKLARITSIVNMYDNLCNSADPEKAMSPYQALSYMYTKCQGMLDMELLAIFIRCLGIYPPGTAVLLSNGVIGLVMSVNPRNPMKPSLVLYDPDIPKSEALIFDMEDEPEVTIERNLKPEKLTPEVYRYFGYSGRANYFVDNNNPAKNIK